MTRRHYVDVAKVIADEVESSREAAAANIARGLADVFAADNPRFDRQRFYFACALNEQGEIES